MQRLFLFLPLSATLMLSVALSAAPKTLKVGALVHLSGPLISQDREAVNALKQAALDLSSFTAPGANALELELYDSAPDQLEASVKRALSSGTQVLVGLSNSSASEVRRAGVLIRIPKISEK